MTGHVPQREGYCKTPKRLLKPTGYLWQCNCGRVYRLSEVVSHMSGYSKSREWREIYHADLRKVLAADAYSEVVR